ncbi:MAG: hypothetical protein LAO31_04920 [Acidobacteriia bacterium]|nr:hypothetical protein [Terriglobia bacterium]
MDMVSADLANAGSNLGAAGHVGFPFPVIVEKNYSQTTFYPTPYSFDRITIFQGMNPNSCDYLPPSYLSDMHGTGTGVNSSGQTSNGPTLFVGDDQNPIPFPSYPDCNAACNASMEAQFRCAANRLPSGSFVVVINIDPNDPNYRQIAPMTLTQNASVDAGGLRVNLNHDPQGDSSGGLYPLQQVPRNRLGTEFPRGSLIVKLAPPITYSVDVTDQEHPVLIRSTQAGSAANPTSIPVATNILGFSQRAQLPTGIFDNPADYLPQPNDFSLIQALEVMVAGRTESGRIDEYKSAIDPTRTFRLNTLSTTTALRNK